MTMNDSSFRAPTLQRYQRAEARRRRWDRDLADAYAYALPDREGRGSAHGDRSTVIYDNTAVHAVQSQKARLHGALCPPMTEWMNFEAPESMKLEPELFQAYEVYAAEVVGSFHGAIRASNFHIEIDSALGDVLFSTGALMIQAGTLDRPLRFEAIPARELVVEEGVDGMLATVFRTFRVAGRHLQQRWPDARLPAATQRAVTTDPDAEVSVIEAILTDTPGGPSTYEVWMTGGDIPGGEAQIVSRRYKASPVIAFRMDKAPGEWMGRGPVLAALPDIRTANKVVELILKNASISVTGIWQAEDDGVLNPANIRLVPGAIIPKAVGSQGLTPLESPGRFETGQLILENLQDSIRQAIMGPALPPGEEGTGRTAFEINVRQQEFQAVEGPKSLRLLTELAYPLASRVLSILSSPAMIGSPFYVPPFEVDGQTIQPRPTSPLVRMQDVADAARAQAAYVQAASAFPDLMDRVVDRAGYLKSFLRDNGFAAEFLAVDDRDAPADEPGGESFPAGESANPLSEILAGIAPEPAAGGEALDELAAGISAALGGSPETMSGAAPDPETGLS